MVHASTKPRRRPVKRRRISATLRMAIVSGVYGPGQQLPTRIVLGRKYRVSPETLQRSFDELKADGFLRARRRAGTFVVDYPPHLHRFGLALGSTPEEPGFTQFFRALAEQARGFRAAPPVEVPVYFGVADRHENEGIARLTQDLQRHRLAGVIYCGFIPERFKDYGLPQVLIGGTRQDENPTVPLLYLSNEHYVQKVVRHFAARRCRRLGVLATAGWERPRHLLLVQACREVGLAFEDQWLQLTTLREPQIARRLTHLLMHRNHRHRPDALLIADDNIIEYVQAGLADAEVVAPRDVRLIAHANFPAAPEENAGLPRLGYDARDVIRAGIDVIQQMRNPGYRPGVIPIEPYFDTELSTQR